MIPITTEINPQGATPQELIKSLVSQLKRQEQEYKACLSDLQRQITSLKKGK